MPRYALKKQKIKKVEEKSMIPSNPAEKTKQQAISALSPETPKAQERKQRAIPRELLEKRKAMQSS